MKNALAKVVRNVMNRTSYQSGKDLVEFQIWSMKNFNCAKEFFERRWKDTSEPDKMEILMIIDSDVVSLSNVEKLSAEAQNRLVELIIIRNKEEDYLPM